MPAGSLGRVLATGAVVAALVLAARVLPGQTIERSVVYVAPISAPPGVESEAELQPIDPLALRAAQRDALAQVGVALDVAAEAVPTVPWNEFGLAHVSIDPTQARLDEARGRYVVDLSEGRTAVLTYDPGLQSHLLTVLARYNEPGEAIVVLDPSTGRVLAMADDGVDPGMGPGLARAPRAYAASTFKVITGAALLEAGAVTPDTRHCYSGGGSGFRLEQLTPGENESTCVTFTEAMARSSNLVFGRFADQFLLPDQLQDVAERFGYNTVIPFEAPLERSLAELPVDRLEFARAAAGFRHTRLTPLHGALIEAAIANEGVMMVPTLVAHIEDASGERVYEHRPTEWRRVLSAEVAEALADTQRLTCTTGTARSDFAQRRGWPRSVRAWGKTGTLSNRSVSGEEPDPSYIFRWFTGVAEREEGEVAVSGLTVTTARWWIKGTYLASEAVLHSLL